MTNDEAIARQVKCRLADLLWPSHALQGAFGRSLEKRLNRLAKLLGLVAQQGCIGIARADAVDADLILPVIKATFPVKVRLEETGSERLIV